MSIRYNPSYGIFNAASPNNYSAVRIGYTWSTRKAVFFAFDFGQIKEPTNRTEICKNVVNWLGKRERYNNDVGVTDVHIPSMSDVWSSKKVTNAVSFGEIYGKVGKEMQINVTARNFDNKSHSNVEIVCEIYEYEYFNVSIRTYEWLNLSNPVMRNRFSKTIQILKESDVTVTFTWTPSAARYYRIRAYAILKSDTNSKNNFLDFGIVNGILKIAKWYDDVESGPNGWTTTTGAEWNIIGDVPNDPNPSNHTAGHVWYCGNNVTKKYSPSQESYLISPTIDLTNIDHRYYVGFAFRVTGKTDVGMILGDFLRPVIRNDTNGAKGQWMLLPYWVYNSTTDVTEPVYQDYYGDFLSDRWGKQTNQLWNKNYTGFILNIGGSNNYGNKIEVGFLFNSDSGTVINPGFYIDDILIWGYEKFTQIPTDIGIQSVSDVGSMVILSYGVPMGWMVPFGKIPISAVVKNYGTTTESFGVKFTVFNEEGVTQPIGDSAAPNGVKQVDSLAAGQNTTITWNWTPAVTGKYYYRIEVQIDNVDKLNDNDLSNNIYDDPMYVSVVDTRNFTLSSNASQLYFNSGEKKDVDLLLNASGGFSGDVAISTTAGSGWTVTVPTSSIALGVNESKYSKITITAPTTDAAQSTTLTVTATSTNPSRTKSINIALILNVTTPTPQYGVELPSTIAPGSTKPGWVANYTISVKNTGNANDSFLLSNTPPNGWSVEFRDSTDSTVITNTGNIATGQSVNVILKITVPSTVSSGDYPITITATSVGNPSKSAILSITTNVTTQPITPTTSEIDFVAEKVSTSPTTDIVEGQEIQLTATISNNGTSKTSASVVGFYLDGLKLKEAALLDINPKGKQTVSILWVAIAGTHNISVRVDPSNKLFEIIEENNIASIDIIVTKAATEDGGKGFLPGYELLILVVAISIGIVFRRKYEWR
jgi:hypothetical protein